MWLVLIYWNIKHGTDTFQAMIQYMVWKSFAHNLWVIKINFEKTFPILILVFANGIYFADLLENLHILEIKILLLIYKYVRVIVRKSENSAMAVMKVSQFSL